jgi:hypothetical protein
MLYYVLKFTISAPLIVAIVEVLSRYSLAGGIFASLLIVSLLGMFWLYIDTGNIEKNSRLSTSIR